MPQTLNDVRVRLIFRVRTIPVMPVLNATMWPGPVKRRRRSASDRPRSLWVLLSALSQCLRAA